MKTLKKQKILKLLEALEATFGNEEFDATNVWGKAQDNSLLAAALEAEVERARYSYKTWRRGDFNTSAIRKGLRQVEGLKATYHPGYGAYGAHWTFRVPENEFHR